MLRSFLLLVALGVGLGVPASSSAQSGGVIEGTLAVARGPAKKTADHYATGPAAPKEVQDVAAVVYLSDDDLARGPAAGTAEVVQRDTAFVPSTLAIRTGTVVGFPNEDPFFHNVLSYSSLRRFDLGRYPRGESREVIYDAPGVALIYCEVHEFMRALIVVTDHPFHAIVADDGSFRIEGVPPGEHTLVAYQPEMGSIERSVVVSAGQTVRVTLTPGSDTTDR